MLKNVIQALASKQYDQRRQTISFFQENCRATALQKLPFAMIAIRSPRTSASSMVGLSVRWYDSLLYFEKRTSQVNLLETGSMPDVGSSEVSPPMNQKKNNSMISYLIHVMLFM